MTKKRGKYRPPHNKSRNPQSELLASSRPSGHTSKEHYAAGQAGRARDLRPDQVRRDPSDGLPGFPPNFGEYPIPHVLTFQGIIGTIAKVYRPSDEAVMDSWDNARFMLNDLGIMECLEQRKRSTALLDWRIEPEDPKDPRQKELAATMTDVLKATPFFTKYRECLQNALWYGKYGVKHRFRWKWIKGHRRLVIDRWEPVHGDKIVFRYDDGTEEYDPDQIGIRVGAGFTSNAGIAQRWSQQRLDKVQVADYGLAYFLDSWERPLLAVHKHIIEDGEYETPMAAGRIHGIGIRHRIYWNWYQKQELLAFLMEFLERSSTGIEIWYYPWGNKEAEEKTRAAAQERIGQGRNIILVPRPIGEEAAYGVERIEPGMAGAEALKDIIKTFYFDQIKRYILGQTLTTEAAATGLGSNLASVHLDTYLQIVRYDATNQEESITRETVQPLQRFNFPAQADVPLFFKLNTESPDVEGKLKAWREAWDMGARLKASQVMDLIGAEAPDKEDEVLQNPQAAQAKAMAAAAQSPGQPAQVRGFRPKTAEEDTADLMRALGISDAGGESGEGRRGDAETRRPGDGSAETGGNGDGRPRVDPLPGGVGDETDASTLPREALKLGTREEMEHTADPAVAMEIAIDHLTEDPHYYDDAAATPENSERVRAVHYCLPDEAFELVGALTIGRMPGRRKTVYVLHPATGEVERYVATPGGVSHEKYAAPSNPEFERKIKRNDNGEFASQKGASDGSQGPDVPADKEVAPRRPAEPELRPRPPEADAQPAPAASSEAADGTKVISRTATEAIMDLVKEVRSAPPGRRPEGYRERGTEYLKVEPDVAERIWASIGLDVAGYRHFLDESALRHILSGHTKARPGADELPLTEEDLPRIVEVVAAPDEIVDAGKTDQGLRAVRYKKRINGLLFYVEEVRTGRKRLAAKTMWKILAPGKR